VENYLDAQENGSPTKLRAATLLRYVENMQEAALENGILASRPRIDFHRSLLDLQLCETYTEVIVADAAHPYVLGIHMRVTRGGSTNSRRW